MPGGLRKPVKPRREQSAADKHHDQINDQRPERSHDATIRFHAIQAKREFVARCDPITSENLSGEKSFVRVGGRDVLRIRQNGA
jgi:hypothetical protein